MGMAAGHVVLLAYLENRVDGIGDDRVVVISGMAQLLAQVPFTDEDNADPGHLLQNSWQVFDRAGVFALDDDEDFPLRSQRPDVGAAVIFLLCESPIAGGAGRRIAADAGWIVEGSLFEPRIAAGADGIPGLFDRADMGKDDPEDADVEHLLGDPLIHLSAVGRNSHHRRDFRRERSSCENLAPVEHVLESLSQTGKVQRRVLHFERDAVQRRTRHGDRALDVHGSKGGEGDPAFFQGFDYAVEARYVWHKTMLLSIAGFLQERLYSRPS